VAPPRTDPDPARAAKRAVYFRSYYLAHRAAILAKNRRWMEEHRERVAELRQARRRAEPPPAPHQCLECGRIVARALRCRTCWARLRYATDPDYRARRLATTRRWLARQSKG